MYWRANASSATSLVARPLPGPFGMTPPDYVEDIKPHVFGDVPAMSKWMVKFRERLIACLTAHMNGEVWEDDEMSYAERQFWLLWRKAAVVMREKPECEQSYRKLANAMKFGEACPHKPCVRARTCKGAYVECVLIVQDELFSQMTAALEPYERAKAEKAAALTLTTASPHASRTSRPRPCES